MSTTNTFLAVIFILAITLPAASFAGPKTTKGDAKTSATSGALYDEIMHMDSVMFAAFNSRDIDKLKQCLDSAIELYQDNIGVRNYDECVAAFSGLFKKDYVLTRRPVKRSMEVYPIKGYGAIQTGLHTFSHTENGQPETATFKFLHIWQKRDGVWKITRLVTYDH